MKLTGPQRKVLKALTEDVRVGRLTLKQRDALVQAVPRLPEPSRRVTKAKKEERFSMAPWSLDELQGYSEATDQQLRALMRTIGSAQRLAREEWSVPVKTRLTSAVRCLSEAYEAMTSGSAGFIDRSATRTGRPVDVWRQTMLEAVAREFMQIGIVPTSTPHGPFHVMARTLLDVGDIAHPDLMRAIKSVRPSNKTRSTT